MRRPVYGGPARMGRIKTATQRHRAGGPGVPWTPGRRPPHRNGGTFGSFGHERTTIIRYVVKKDSRRAKPKNQATRPRPLKPIKKKATFAAGRGCGVSRRVTAPGRPASQFWQRSRRGRVRGLPQSNRPRHGRTRAFPAASAYPLVLSVPKEHRNCCPCNYRFPPKTAILYKRRQESAKSCAGGAGGRAPAIDDPAAAPPRGKIEETAAFATS